MKKSLLSILLFGIITACMAQTTIVDSWRDAETTIQTPGIHSIVVAALLNDQVVRRQVEDYMASLYPGSATPSYKIFGDDSLLHKEESHYNDLLKKGGYDGIVLMKQISQNTTERFVSGRPPIYMNTWGGYWHAGWGNRWAGHFVPGTPGRIQQDHTWNVQVTVFSVESNKLIWAANTSTVDPGGRLPLFKDVCKAVKKQMRSEGFLK